MRVLFPTEVSSFDFQVECTDRTVQYKLNAQSLRLFGLHRDVNDAHRAGANRLQKQKKQKNSSNADICKKAEFYNASGIPAEFYGLTAKTRYLGRRENSKRTKIWGILLGHVLIAGGIWEEEILIAEIEEQKKLDASETYPEDRIHKNTFCVLRFPRSITDWIGFGLGWFGKLDTRYFSERLLNEFSNWLLFNCRTQLIFPLVQLYLVSMRSLVVFEEANIVFQTTSLQFSIFQFLKYNGLEVFLGG